MDAKQKLLKKFNWHNCTTWNYCCQGGIRSVPAYSPGAEPLHQMPPDLVFCTAVPLGSHNGVLRGHAPELRWHPKLVDCPPNWRGKTWQGQDWPVGFRTGFTLCYRLNASFPPCQFGKMPLNKLLPTRAGTGLNCGQVCIIVMAGNALFSSI